MKNQKQTGIALALGLSLSGCGMTMAPPELDNPALRYSRSIQRQQDARAGLHPNYVRSQAQPRAQLRYASDELPPDPNFDRPNLDHLGAPLQEESAPEYYEYRSQSPNIRDYNGPLSLGDPGVSASLWQESRGGNELVRDDRAWLPMDLLTIIVSENAQGSKEADTEIKSESTITAAITALLGIEDSVTKRNTQVEPASLIDANTTNEYKGEGETTRKGSLKARVSAMVVEVLPSGILRVEGEKIISVNTEEQVIKISGLVRTKDVNSANEVDSSKIANMRIDYFGRGAIGDAQSEGWGGTLIRKVWPF